MTVDFIYIGGGGERNIQDRTAKPLTQHQYFNKNISKFSNRSQFSTFQSYSCQVQ